MNRDPRDSNRNRPELASRQSRHGENRQEPDYRGRALKLFPWVCGRCGREFKYSGLTELTVHHKDHNHDNNPPDGSNWELLCLYCHDNEHSRYVDTAQNSRTVAGANDHQPATSQPFANLKQLLEDKS